MRFFNLFYCYERLCLWLQKVVHRTDQRIFSWFKPSEYNQQISWRDEVIASSSGQHWSTALLWCHRSESLAANLKSKDGSCDVKNRGLSVSTHQIVRKMCFNINTWMSFWSADWDVPWPDCSMDVYNECKGDVRQDGTESAFHSSQQHFCCGIGADEKMTKRNEGAVNKEEGKAKKWWVLDWNMAVAPSWE